jgi:group I intron endonuclease
MERKGIIYVVTNKVNGKQYVGQTLNSLNSRKSGHFHVRKKNDQNNYFHNALRKHGEDNFDWEILEENINERELDDRESYYIDKFGTFKNGYNLTTGGSTNKRQKGRIKFSKKSREKMSLSRKRYFDKNRIIFNGCPMSPETRSKISKWHIGKTISDETKHKMSLANLGKKLSEEHKEKVRLGNLGKKHSEESKRKMSESRMGSKNHFHGKHHTKESRVKNAIGNHKRGLLPNNSSGLKGVSKLGKKWRAVIRYNGDRLFLGQYDDKIDAAKEYDKKLKELYGEDVISNKDLGLY